MRLSTVRTYLYLLLLFVAWISSTSLVNAQGMGGPGGGQDNAPAFIDPKFRDRMWEAGGPRLSGLNSGQLVLGVEVVGNNAVSSHKILSHMQTREDRNFDEKQLQADIHELYRTDLFRKITPSIRQEKGGVVVVLEVVEQPTVNEVVFHGNKAVEDRMLKKHCAIEKGDPINPFSVDMARQRLIDLYHENGFNQVAIEVREGNKAGDRRVYFEISEGPLERIWDIRFEGNAIFNDALLATKIKSRDARSGVTSYMFNKANLLQIREDVDRLVAYYRSLGYFQTRVDYRLNYYEDGNFADLVFVISEGQQFKIRNIAVMGNRYFTTEQLMAALGMKSGDPFNLGKMMRDQRTLRNEYYGRQGFVFVDITPEPRFLDEPGQLDLVYRITEGDQYRAGDIRVHIDGDASHTQHQVALNLIGIRPGQLIDLQELENSERRLKSCQIFESNPAEGKEPSIEVQPPEREASLTSY